MGRSLAPATAMASIAALATMLRWCGGMPPALDDWFYAMVFYAPTAALVADWLLERLRGRGS